MDDLGKLRIVEGECSKVLATLNPSFSLVYIDPPFNTGKAQSRGEISYEDSFEDYLGFLVPLLKEARRLLTPTGSFFIHVDPRESHYLKVELDKIFGRDCFQNEIIWAYDYGGRSKKKWSSKHDVIFWYTKDPKEYTFNYDDIDRIPYMAPGLVGPEKAAKGKTPTDCYDESTEVLTDRGWVFFSELKEGDLVASVSPQGTLEFFKPKHIIRKEFRGEMIGIKSKTVDLLVTPSHSMYVRKKNVNKFDFVEAGDLFDGGQYVSLMNKLLWGGDGGRGDVFVVPDHGEKRVRREHDIGPFDMEDWCEFMGWFISEGCTLDAHDSKYKGRYEVYISQTKEKTKQELNNLLSKMGFYYRYNGKEFVISNKKLWSYLRPLGKQPVRRIPRCLLNLNAYCLERLLKGLIMGDGSNRVRKPGWENEISFFTSSEGLADDVQELFLKLGFNSSKTPHNRKDTHARGQNDCWRVLRRTSKESTVWRDRHLRREFYSGPVYCCTVEPYHTLVVRRGGRPVVCGNCWWHTIVHTNGKEKTGYPCLRPGSDVLTESGWRSIESVLIGDKVLAANGEFCEVFDVSSHLCGDDLFRLSVGEEFMDATQNHPFLIWREGAVAWVNAGGVKVGDYMMTPLLSDKGLATLKPCEERKEQEESSRKGTSKYEKGENVNWLMSLYGKQQTDPSHPDFNCTTGTGILRTTSFPISNLSTHLHTSGFTQVANSEMEFGGSLVKRAGNSNLRQKSFGTFPGDILTERFVESASSRRSSRSVEFVLRQVNHVDTVPYCGPVWNLSVTGSPTFQTRVGMSHNTQKPLGILKRIVRVHSQPGDNLLDFFAGSGSFGEAALSLGRNVVLVDNNPQAIEVMERRLGEWA